MKLDVAGRGVSDSYSLPDREIRSQSSLAGEFFRIEGPQEPRRYMAWRPTHAPNPNFHVPSAFGRLRFSD